MKTKQRTIRIPKACIDCVFRRTENDSGFCNFYYRKIADSIYYASYYIKPKWCKAKKVVVYEEG